MENQPKKAEPMKVKAQVFWWVNNDGGHEFVESKLIDGTPVLPRSILSRPDLSKNGEECEVTLVEGRRNGLKGWVENGPDWQPVAGAIIVTSRVQRAKDGRGLVAIVNRRRVQIDRCSRLDLNATYKIYLYETRDDKGTHQHGRVLEMVAQTAPQPKPERKVKRYEADLTPQKHKVRDENGSWVETGRLIAFQPTGKGHGLATSFKDGVLAEFGVTRLYLVEHEEGRTKAWAVALAGEAAKTEVAETDQGSAAAPAEPEPQPGKPAKTRKRIAKGGEVVTDGKPVEAKAKTGGRTRKPRGRKPAEAESQPVAEQAQGASASSTGGQPIPEAAPAPRTQPQDRRQRSGRKTFAERYGSNYASSFKDGLAALGAKSTSAK